MSYIGELYLITDDIIDTEDTEETEFIDDVLLGRGDHLLVVVDDETQPTAGHHRAQEQQTEQNLSHPPLIYISVSIYCSALAHFIGMV